LFPEHDSRFVNSHLREQEQRLRAAVAEHKIIWLTEDVVLAVHTEADFPAERAELARAGIEGIRLPDLEPTDTEVDALVGTLGEQLPEARAKLARKLAQSRVEQMLELILRDRVSGAVLEQHLDAHDPFTYEGYQAVKQRERRRVQRESAERTTAASTVADLRDRTAERFGNAIVGVMPADADRLAEAAIAEWLLECSLDFPGAGDG